MTQLGDAHNHLQDPRFVPHLRDLARSLESAGVTRCIVNGTCEADWPRVRDLAIRLPGLVQPSFGLHPWNCTGRSPGWLTSLQGHLDAFPRAGLGECGLDRWIEGFDLDDQTGVFRSQLALAATRNLPLTIHCLRAWGPLLECLRRNPLPERGFLLHSYGGSPELVDELVPLGAWFSFSGAFLHPRKQKVREAFRRVPADRLLVETDAPDMLPPADARFRLPSGPDGRPINHPANLPAIADALAGILAVPTQTLRRQLARNFTTFFGPPP